MISVAVPPPQIATIEFSSGNPALHNSRCGIHVRIGTLAGKVQLRGAGGGEAGRGGAVFQNELHFFLKNSSLTKTDFQGFSPPPHHPQEMPAGSRPGWLPAPQSRTLRTEANCCLLQAFLLFSVTFSISRGVRSAGACPSVNGITTSGNYAARSGEGAAAGKGADFPSPAPQRGAGTVTKALTSPLSSRGSHCPCGSGICCPSRMRQGPSFFPGWTAGFISTGSAEKPRLSEEPRSRSRSWVRPCVSRPPWEEARCISETLTTVLAP